MDWLIGDIHGMLRPLRSVLDAVTRADPRPRPVFLGDYVNRGPDSRGVIDLLLGLDRAIFLRGNHDDIFDLLVNDDCYICHPHAPDAPSAFSWFMQHGLEETLASYGIDRGAARQAARQPDRPKLDRLLAPMPDTHRRFLRSLEPVFETPGYFAAHGYWSPDDPDALPDLRTRLAADAEARYRLLWGRFTDEQLDAPKRWKRTGWFGHTPVHNYLGRDADMTPVRGERLVLVDTAAAVAPVGRLTAVCADTGQVIQADRSGRIVPTEPEDTRASK